jgi:hypothetical protein
MCLGILVGIGDVIYKIELVGGLGNAGDVEVIYLELGMTSPATSGTWCVIRIIVAALY